MRKFSKTQFRKWLDCIAKITCKTDDNFACQIRKSPECTRIMQPKDYNCQWCHIKAKKSYNVRWLRENAITGCAKCHGWAHDNPDEFGVWFADKYPHRMEIINEHRRLPSKTWKEQDFKNVEAELLLEAYRVGVKWYNVGTSDGFDKRMKRAMERMYVV